MSVTEIKHALGSWSINLRPDTPREILDAIAPFGHLAVLPGRIDVAQAGENLLTAARYVGVMRTRVRDDTGTTQLGGAGMAFWLGDEDGKGAVWESAKTFAASTFANTIRSLLPNSGSITEGTLYSVPGTYSGSHIYETPRQSITYVTDTFGTDVSPVSWRVNGDGTLDAGRDSDLFSLTPDAILVRKEDAGRDFWLNGLAGQMELGDDVEDYTTKVLLVAEGEGSAAVIADAEIVTDKLDIHGNLVSLTRVISEFETDATNAAARAQLQLNRFVNPRYSVNLSTEEYDIKGSFGIGDRIYIYDPDIGFQDTNNEVTFRGTVINPKSMTVNEMTWPVPTGWTVAFRTQIGTWLDLSEYYQPEGGAATIVVGEFSRSINDSSTQPVGNRPIGDGSIPATPTFGASTTGSYQSGANGSGLTFAQIQLTWTQPLNTDGSTVLDGDRYEIRYRITGSPISTSWDGAVVAWGTNTYLVTGLIPGTSYDFQIRAVDGAVPANVSAWSTTNVVVSAADIFAPSTPAAPTVAASRIAVQVSHNLGVAASGTFNLETDLDRLEVHAGASASFTPSNSTRIGKLPATVANIRGLIPAVGTFPVESTSATWIKVVAVDTSGNSSGASVGASATALLIDNAHISDLTVSKVTAGTIGATWINGGLITTAASGPRVELAGAGLSAYNAAGSATVVISGVDGSATVTGRFKTGFAGAGQPYVQMDDTGDRSTITFWNSSGSGSAFMNSPQDGASASQIGINSATFTYGTTPSQTSRQRLFLANSSGSFLGAIRTSDGASVGGRVSVTATAANMDLRDGNAAATGGFVEVGTTSTRMGYQVAGARSGGTVLTNSSGAFLQYLTAGNQDGGNVVLSSTAARISATNTGTVASELALFDDAAIWLTGRWSIDNAIGGDAAHITGAWTVDAGATATVTYGSTMGTTPWTILSLKRDTTAAADFHVRTQTTTNFTFWGPSGGTSTTYTYWNVRLI